jgi:hypothetical protein
VYYSRSGYYRWKRYSSSYDVGSSVYQGLSSSTRQLSPSPLVFWSVLFSVFTETKLTIRSSAERRRCNYAWRCKDDARGKYPLVHPSKNEKLMMRLSVCLSLTLAAFRRPSTTRTKRASCTTWEMTGSIRPCTCTTTGGGVFEDWTHLILSA